MKWEYDKVYSINLYGLSLDVISGLGARGWELVSVDGGVGYFKRPKEDNGKEATVQEEIQEAEDEEDQDKPKASRLYAEEAYPSPSWERSS